MSEASSSSSSSQNTEFDEFREKMKELDVLSGSQSSELGRSGFDPSSIKRKTSSLRLENEDSLIGLKVNNISMKEKLERLQDISAENLLLQSDAADFQAELAELKAETQDLRSKCYNLTEENRQCRAEVKDLRRYIELLKANKDGDSKKDLLNKIEFYEMEHERLKDDVRRMKQRLGEVSPRVDSRPSSRGQSYYRQLDHSPNSTALEIAKMVKQSQRVRSPVSNALAASTASALAAGRLVKDRSLSPNAALSFRDLTMNRYNQHMDDEGQESLHSDCTEELLEAHLKEYNGEEHLSHITNGDVASNLNRSINDYGSYNSDDEMKRCERRSNGTNSMSSPLLHSGPIESQHCDRPTSPAKALSMRTGSSPSHSTNQSLFSSSGRKSLPRRAFAPRSPADLNLGHSIKFTRPGGKLSKGVVTYVGHLPTRDEIYIGVELDDYDGKHSGTYQGIKYFSCSPNKGIFTPFSKVVMAWE